MAKMVGIIIISHGSLSDQLIDTSKMIAGDQPKVVSLGLEISQGLEDLKEAIEQKYLELNELDEGVLVLVDLPGGTPCNAAFMMLEKLNLSIVSGVNLPMLLEVLVSRNGKSLEELTDIAVQSGKEGVRNISELYKVKKESNCAESK